MSRIIKSGLQMILDLCVSLGLSQAGDSVKMIPFGYGKIPKQTDMGKLFFMTVPKEVEL